MQPISIYFFSGTGSPNPIKVLIILEELGVPYATNAIPMDTLKQKPYTDINPNGRVPAMKDPNTGMTLWESNAIIEYLMDKYDTEGKLSYKTEPETYFQKQWSYFQASGQGPYFGQAAWFNMFHEGMYGESPESAKKRYGAEVKRVAGVLDSVLAQRQWLVGDKCTYVDLEFFQWDNQISYFMGSREGDEAFSWDAFPHFKKWHDTLAARPAVASVLKRQMDPEIKSEGSR